MPDTNSPNFWVIIPAAGIGSRMQADRPKQYMQMSDLTILEHTVNCFVSRSEFTEIAIAIADDDQYWPRLDLSENQRISCYSGGQERADSVLNGLLFLADKAGPDDWVWVHDAARPCLSNQEIDRLIEALQGADEGLVLAVPIHDTVKRADKNSIIDHTVDREGLWRAMTPQIFRFSLLKSALERCVRERVCITDEASAIEYCGGRPALVSGSERNIKVTHPEDLAVAARTIGENQNKETNKMKSVESFSKKMVLPRIGTGFDVHAFGSGNAIILGGVSIPYSQGLIAHSDGDVLLHAIMDALLGALALGDIGKHFPDTDPEWKGADSRSLLRAVSKLVKEKGFCVGNMDTTIIAQAPKMAPFIELMRKNIAEDLDMDWEGVSVKATTTERLGFTGRKEGVACQASVILMSI